MGQRIIDVFASIVVLAMITAVTRPRSQAPKLAQTVFTGFQGSLREGLGGSRY